MSNQNKNGIMVKNTDPPKQINGDRSVAAASENERFSGAMERGDSDARVPNGPTMKDRTAVLAYELWQARGCPEGSADEDWFDAARQLSA